MSKENISGAANEEEKEDVKELPRKKEISKPDYGKFEREIRSHFEDLTNKIKVIKTTITPSGQILDWIRIEAQQPEGKISHPPPDPIIDIFDKEKQNDKFAKFELESSDAELGPEGTVPILRKDLKKLNFRNSLQDYLSKHGRKTYPMYINEHDSLEVPTDGAHDYCYTAQYVTCYGGEGYLSAFDPYLQWSNEFSLLQIAVVRGSGNGKQTIEAGWQEYRNLYGDWVPHLFIFYTTNGYSQNGNNLGGYNRDVTGWVQYSNVVYPGAISSPNSVRGGDQYVMQIKYQLYQGNWWLYCNGRWIGYYPAALFNESGLRSNAEKVAFYGEVVDSSSHSGLTHTDMGSGYWPEYRWQWAAYLRSLRYQSNTSGSMSQYNAATIFASDPDMYDIESHVNSGSTWGSYAWLGGPGA
jgi:hypothetical protein